MTEPLNALQRERIDAVLALAASRQQAPEQRLMLEDFGREYFAQLQSPTITIDPDGSS